MKKTARKNVTRKINIKYPDHLKALHDLSFGNKSLVLSSFMGLCSCFYCCGHFYGAAVKEFTSVDKTAICPKCGIDSVIPFMIPPSVIKKMKKKYFGALFINKLKKAVKKKSK